jgi:membrane-bound lytic murein transglycosylase B
VLLALSITATIAVFMQPIGSSAQVGVQDNNVKPASPAGAAEPSPGNGTAAPANTRPSFAEWLVELRAEALTRGIRQDIVDEALGDLQEPLPVVIERDRSQAEIVLPLESYIARRLKPAVIQTGREMMARHSTVLAAVSAKYGVPSPIIVAIWGIESNFGRFTGVRPTVAALATLAWDPRRSAFFRNELFDALEILNRGDIELSKMRGSWAGAMGQTQFIPSSYLRYAEDFDGDGRRDIWSSPADVFASIANYLKGYGWSAEEGWGREVRVTPEAAEQIAATVARREGNCAAKRDMTVSQTMAEWRALGVTTLNGRPLPKSEVRASLVSGSKRHFLVLDNYDSLLGYNCAHAYAVSVGLLADQIGATAPKTPPAVAARRSTKKSPERPK